MSTITDRVTKEALALSADARLSLVGKLLTSLNLQIDEEIERLWAEEAERSVVRLETGGAKPVPGGEVLSKIIAKQDVA